MGEPKKDNLSFFDIVAKIESLAQAKEQADKERLTELSQALITKVDSYRNVLSVITSEVDRLSDAESEIKARKKSLRSLESSLKDNIKLYMQQKDLTELQGDTYKAQLRSGSERLITASDFEVNMMTAAKFPKYFNVTVSVDAKAVKDAISTDSLPDELKSAFTISQQPSLFWQVNTQIQRTKKHDKE